MHIPLKLSREELSPLFYTDPEIVNLTGRLFSHDGLVIPEVLQLLREHGVLSDEVAGIYRGQPGDSGVYVEFKSQKGLETIKDSDLLYVGNKNIEFKHLGRQNISVRLHWLPLFVDDSLIRRILCEFGTIKRVDREYKDENKVKILTGIRRIDMEVTEEGKMAIPHIVIFPDGSRALLTIPGRQPLCLRCNNIGHVRRDCKNELPARRTYAQITNTVQKAIQVQQAAQSKKTTSNNPSGSASGSGSSNGDQGDTGDSAADPSKNADDPSNLSGDSAVDPSYKVDNPSILSEDNPVDPSNNADDISKNQDSQDDADENEKTDDEDMDVQDASSKRRHEEGESDSDYEFPKNKTQKVPDSLSQGSVSTSNSFDFGSNLADVQSDLRDMLDDDQ